MRPNRLAVALLLPYGALVLLMLVAPVAELLTISFHRHAETVPAGTGFSLDAYARAANGYYLRILWDTFRLAVLATIIAAVCGYPVAYVIARSRRVTRAVLSCIVMIPLMTSIVVKTFGWYILLGRHGPVATLLTALGLAPGPLLGNDYAVLLGLVEFSLPFMIFSLVAAIDRIPILFEEAAANLGAHRLAVFFKVIVPSSRAGLLSGALLCFGSAASAYVVPAMLGGRSSRMVAQQIYSDVLVAFDWPGAAALCMVLLVVLGGTVYAGLALCGRRAS